MKKGLFSVSYSGLWGQHRLGTEEFIAKAAELGYDGVLLMAKRPHLSVADADDGTIDRVATALERAKIELIGLAAYTDYLLPAPGEVPIGEVQEIYVDACVRLCARLGGKVVRIFTGYDYGDVARGTQESKVIAAIAASARRAKDQGILLSVQNHHDLAVHTKEFVLLLDSIGEESVRAGYDAWSPHLRGEDLYDGARTMASRMFMTICADYLTFPRYRYQPELVNYLRVEPDSAKATLMGQGEIDYGAFFRGLKDGGFDADGDGWAVYEMCSPVVGGGSIENLDRHARAFLAWLEKNV